ncbi:MAG: hypothetical protein FD143_772 [Ignavibacteria bacterium]|nr:MAG: hypothetical protein FD143_772 [Ignavibacteria bacterium]KAF0161385.1 MAG: hypothetical protein FD188_973 [Ignavibacteria bacterium]
MGRETKIKENVLYEIWNHHGFKSKLSTPTGDDIVILDKGTQNIEVGGPDFHNARIVIGNLTYVGDVEIDCAYSDWKTHGHHLDSKYNRVVLHVTLLNKNNYSHVYTRDGRKVPTVCLKDFLEPELTESITHEYEESQKNSAKVLKCDEVNESFPREEKERFLSELGIIRFEKKCKKIYTRLKELVFLSEMKVNEPVISYELTGRFQEKSFSHNDFRIKDVWQQLMYELIFEALGYSKNKTQMADLAKHANIKFFSKIETDGVVIEKYESILFFISGLIQNTTAGTGVQTKEYLERLNFHWNSSRTMYDGKLMDETEWHFFRLRPQNFPTIRIAGGARILFSLLHGELIRTMIKKITEIHSHNVLSNSLRSLMIVKAEGYWKNHYVFDEAANSELKYFVGVSRADEIVVNVLIPFFTVYFDVFGNQSLSKKLLKMYTSFQQKGENQIITEVAVSLKINELVRKTVIAQGSIELYRNYCSRNKCLECRIGKSVFS